MKEFKGRHHEVPRSKPELPEIKLEFHGDYTKSAFFKDSFDSTIDNETDLSLMQKHQYLVSVLRGILKVMEIYKMSIENCLEEWKLLKGTYGNKMIIIII